MNDHDVDRETRTSGGSAKDAPQTVLLLERRLREWLRVMYVFCRHNDIVVGGPVQVGRDSETISEQDRATFERIWAMRGRCSRAIPRASPPSRL